MSESSFLLSRRTKIARILAAAHPDCYLDPQVPWPAEGTEHRRVIEGSNTYRFCDAVAGVIADLEDQVSDLDDRLRSIEGQIPTGEYG